MVDLITLVGPAQPAGLAQPVGVVRPVGLVHPVRLAQPAGLAHLRKVNSSYTFRGISSQGTNVYLS